VELFVAREPAEHMLREVLEDEPAWAGMLKVVAVDLGPVSEN
jgi:hypothetical protein